MLTTDAEGRPRHKLDYAYKKRRDFLLERDHPMYLRVNDIIMRRCVPEIKRAFQVEVSHTDRFLIACYPGDGGHFRRHRDNRPAIVAFRRFALSINLTVSAEGYEGGFLRLPEFSSHNYRSPTGAGLLCSVALLHEITPVLRGDMSWSRICTTRRAKRNGWRCARRWRAKRRAARWSWPDAVSRTSINLDVTGYR